MASAADLGGAGDPHLGAPDENATARLLEFVRDTQSDVAGDAVLRDAAPLEHALALPRRPGAAALRAARPVAVGRRREAPQPLPQQRAPAGAHGRPRCSASCAALPGWDDTVVVFVSDHGEEFREHGGMYHLTSLFDEQVRIPGWLVAGPRGARRRAARGPRDVGERGGPSRSDVNATVLDLLGVLDARPGVPVRRPAPRPLAAAPARRGRPAGAAVDGQRRVGAGHREVRDHGGRLARRAIRRPRAGTATTRSATPASTRAPKELAVPGAHRDRDARRSPGRRKRAMAQGPRCAAERPPSGSSSLAILALIALVAGAAGAAPDPRSRRMRAPELPQKEALDRETPRRTMDGFLRETKAGQLPGRRELPRSAGHPRRVARRAGPSIWRRSSGFILERQRTLNLDKIPDVPEGDPAAKPPGTFVADTLYAGEEPVPIALRRAHFSDGVDRWLIAPSTVALIPVIDAAYGPRPIGVQLPASLTQPDVPGQRALAMDRRRPRRARRLPGGPHAGRDRRAGPRGTSSRGRGASRTPRSSSRRGARCAPSCGRSSSSSALGPLQLTTAVVEVCEHVIYTASGPRHHLAHPARARAPRRCSSKSASRARATTPSRAGGCGRRR